jgi:hypothetical protein
MSREAGIERKRKSRSHSPSVPIPSWRRVSRVVSGRRFDINNRLLPEAEWWVERRGLRRRQRVDHSRAESRKRI